MEIFKIEILDPKAKSILKNLADLKLITIKRARTKSDTSKMFNRLRQYSELISSEDIAAEVDIVRDVRYGKKETESHP